MMNGVSLSSMIGGGWGGGAIPNATGLQEMVFDTASVSAELATGGVRINFIAREGGNQYHGTLFGSFANDSLQATNIGADLLARNPALANAGHASTRTGTSTPASAVRSSATRSGSSRAAATRARTCSRPACSTTRTPTTRPSGTTCPISSRPASLEKTWQDAQLRLSWQATPEEQDRRHLHAAGLLRLPRRRSPPRSRPRPANDRRFPMQRVVLLDWTSPVTNKLLIEASGIHRVERWGNMHLQTKGLDLDPQMIGVVEQGGAIPGLRYRGASSTARAGGTYNNSWNNNFHWRFHVSYITGSHAFKVGVERRVRLPREHDATCRTRCRTASTTACRTRSRMRALPHTVEEPRRPRPRALRAGQVDDQPADAVAAASATTTHANSFPEQTLGPTSAHADPEPHVPGAGQPELARHHAEEPGGRTTCSATARRRSRSA